MWSTLPFALAPFQQKSKTVNEKREKRGRAAKTGNSRVQNRFQLFHSQPIATEMRSASVAAAFRNKQQLISQTKQKSTNVSLKWIQSRCQTQIWLGHKLGWNTCRCCTQLVWLNAYYSPLTATSRFCSGLSMAPFDCYHQQCVMSRTTVDLNLESFLISLQEADLI